MLLPNVPATIAAWFGVWDAGGAFVPLNPRVPPAELARSIASTGVAAVVTTADSRDLPATRSPCPARRTT